MNTRILIAIRRGVIQRLKSTHPGVEVKVIDLDAVDQEPADSPIRDRADLLLCDDEDHPWDVVE